jgi:hypothetical protein
MASRETRMASCTREQIEWTRNALGVDPDDYPATTAPSAPASGGGGADGKPWAFNPLKPQAPSLFLDANTVAAMDEARKWVTAYLTGNNVAAAQGADPGVTLVFAGKPTPIKTIIGATLAAAKLARLDEGEKARGMIDEAMIRGVIGDLVKPKAATEDDADAAKPAAKKDDDGIETTLEVTNQDVQTSIQFTIKLRAQGDDDPRRVVILPDVEISLHLGHNATTSSVEAQLNLIKVKQDVSKHLQFNGHVIIDSIEFKAGVSAEANMADAALAQIQKSIEVKVKAELEFKVNKAFSFSVEADAGKDGVVVGPKLIFHF